MKAIIDGKRYNTETATEIAQWSNNYYCNDFHYCEETLYRTKRGAWFIAGDGGALSSYSQSYGSNGSIGGSSITPLKEWEAQAWLEEKGHVDKLETYFEEAIEDA